MNNEEMTKKLAKYMQEDGRYNAYEIALEFDAPITEDDPYGLNATLGAYFDANDEEQSFEESPELAFAKAYNSSLPSKPMSKKVTIESPVGFEDMYISYEVEIESNSEITQESIDALVMRETSLQYGKSAKDIDYAMREYIDQMTYITKDNGIREKAYRLLAIGNELFEQGYRLRETHRSYNGVKIEVPDNAIIFRDVDAYYIGTGAAHKIIYVVKS